MDKKLDVILILKEKTPEETGFKLINRINRIGVDFNIINIPIILSDFKPKKIKYRKNKNPSANLMKMEGVKYRLVNGKNDYIYMNYPMKTFLLLCLMYLSAMVLFYYFIF
ncbi:hypothetical protein [Photorhabdus akhurstii]|uniref:hypothetical protein n=1 Tax=Photorhabdus akhurstii TaxID=171438 RepID=UPI0037039C60